MKKRFSNANSDHPHRQRLNNKQTTINCGRIDREMRLLIALFLFFHPWRALSSKIAAQASDFKLRKFFDGTLFQEQCDSESHLADRGVEEFVNVLGGTNSRFDISHGSTLPLVTRPWGFNSYAPMTDDDPTWSGWWFHPSDRRFFGMRVTHQPSPWISDYGNFLIKAYMPSNPSDSTASKDKFTGYSPYSSEFHPYYFSTNFYSYGNSNGNLQFELAPSLHGGIIRASFPKFVASEVGDSDNHGSQNQIRRIAVTLSGASDAVQVIKSPIDGTPMISGFTKKNSGGVGSSTADFTHYFVLAIYNGVSGSEIASMSSSHAGGQSAWIDFNPEDSNNDILIVRFATSLISTEQALQNLKSEIPSTLSFDELRIEAQSDWRDVLSRVRITEPPLGYDECTLKRLYSIFYTSVYRASIFPRQISEVDPSGNLIHWSPYAKTNETRVMPGALSTDSGFWDAWNTIYPLLGLYHRPYLGTSIQGWVNAYVEGEWLPKWASPGYRGSMVGTMGDVSLADAIVNDIPNFDVKKAYEAIRKDAFDIPPSGVEGVGRVCLESYLKYGYVPRESPATTGGTCSEVVSRTLNYLQSDFAIAQAALKLGYKDDAAALAMRYENFSLTFDGDTGFFRSKVLGAEKWTVPFDQYAWGGDYTEGGPYQFRFYLPYDPKGLADVYAASGRDMCQELLNVQTVSHSTFHIGGYGEEIHEQTELPDHCWGQYAHNNQPVHHMLYMHMYDGYQGACSNQGRYWIREVLLNMYKADANMFPGDEDNGEMAAWFVLSSLGLYQRSPGSGNYEFGLPLFGSVEIDISDISHNHPLILSSKGKSAERKVLKIVAKNNSYENTYVKRITWNGEEIPKDQDAISYAKLAEGGTLVFELGPNPSTASWSKGN
jgi:predicted alpha-1,2-mannosidase